MIRCFIVALVVVIAVSCSLLAYSDESTSKLIDELADPNLNPMAKDHLLDKGTEALPSLIKALRSDNVLVRKSACEVLGKIASPVAVPPLLDTLGDENVDVRKAAVFALGEIGDKKAAPALKELLQDTAAPVRANAAFALGLLGDNSVQEELIDSLTDKDDTVRSYAAKSLGILHSTQAAYPLYQKLLHDKSPYVRALSAEALGRIQSQQAIRGLITALSDEDLVVRRRAIWALESITGKKFDYYPDDPVEKRLEAQNVWLTWFDENCKDIASFTDEAYVLKPNVEKQMAPPAPVIRDYIDEERASNRQAPSQEESPLDNVPKAVLPEHISPHDANASDSQPATSTQAVTQVTPTVSINEVEQPPKASDGIPQAVEPSSPQENTSVTIPEESEPPQKSGDSPEPSEAQTLPEDFVTQQQTQTEKPETGESIRLEVVSAGNTSSLPPELRELIDEKPVPKRQSVKKTPASVTIQDSVDDATMASFFLKLGQSYIARGEYAQAVEKIQKSLEIDSTSAPAYALLGRAYQKLGSASDAKEAYEKSLGLDPENVTVLNNLAVLLIDEKAYDSALEYLQKALEIDDEDIELLCNTGDVYRLKENYAKAITFYERALKMSDIDASGLKDITQKKADYCKLILELKQ